MELKVQTTQESLTLQNKTHELKCFVNHVLRTNRIQAFKDYLEGYDVHGYSLYYNQSGISAWPVLANGGMDWYDEPVAVCTLEYTDELKLLVEHINRDISEKNFCIFLRKMAKFGKMIELKDTIENMEMKKIVYMAKSKDSRGNFSYEYSVKDAGKGTFNPPKYLIFTIPLFKHIEKAISFNPEFVFQYYMAGVDETKEAKITYRLEMLDLDQFIEQACTVLIEDQMEQFSCPKYWGTLEKKQATDEWKYKDVPMEFKGIPVDKEISTERKY